MDAKPENIEVAILAGLCAESLPEDQNSSEESLDELEELLRTAGGSCVAKILQNRTSPDPRTFIGGGKACEIRELAEINGAVLAVFDNELSAAQIRALEEETGLTVIDRSALILDIFARRAITKEGRLQVELAQYKYLLPRLSGMGKSLSRLGGGIGTRGPGETKLETDRRHIRERIYRLERELKDVQKVRAVQRERRLKNEVPVVALVGYTNAGKSSLLNALTQTGIPANDRLFDTLDTTTRRLGVSDTLEILLSDTVGFISKLPHHLIEAFKATLEELKYADLLIHVVDVSNPEWTSQKRVVEKLIEELGVSGTPVIEAYNKIDRCGLDSVPAGKGKVALSATTGEGIEGLIRGIADELEQAIRKIKLLIPYDSAGLLDELYKLARVEKVDYTDDGIHVDAQCNHIILGKVRRYLEEA